MKTSLEQRIELLADLFIFGEEEHPELKEFIAWANIGLPLARSVQSGLVILTGEGEKTVSKTFDQLLAVIGKTDTGFDSLSSLLG